MTSLPATLIDENKALKARVAELEAALEPFVRIGDLIRDYDSFAGRPAGALNLSAYGKAFDHARFVFSGGHSLERL